MRILNILLSSLLCSSCTTIQVPEQVEVTTQPTIKAIKTNRKINGLYIYEVNLQDNKGDTYNIEMISGRPNKQDTNQEHIADIGSPLQSGIYKINPRIITAPDYKFGGIFIGFEPTFKTARYDLGFHHDPEFNSNSKEVGTVGCLATVTREDKLILINFIKQHQPNLLIVQ